jgi:hyperosmotically inducible protein
MKIAIKIALNITFLTVLSGCLALAAGAGVEGGYVASQESRTAGETIDDQRITASIKTQLLADTEISGLDINVDTFKGIVTLKGVVGSAHEAEKALQIAKSVKGVSGVESKLFVD